MTPTEYDLNKPMSTRLKTIVCLLCLLVLGAGVVAGIRFVQTRPKPPQRPPVKIAPLVETISVRPQTQTVTVHALGTVIPARQTTIRAEVSGTVREVGPGFLPGGQVPRGAMLLRLDAEEYQLAVAGKEAELQRAKAELELEQGYQQVARHEWTLLQRGGKTADSPDLALRKPQLAQALAKVRQAETALEQARLDLRRTTISAPFAALILDKNAEVGMRVGTQETVAVLVDAREYWVEATLPVDRLPWITFSDGGPTRSPVRITSQASGAWREGRLLKLRGNLEDQGRMARFLATLPAPLEARPAPLLLGEYVRLEIQGRTLEQVVVLPRVALRENDTVWTVVDATLRIAPVKVAWRDTYTVLVEQGLGEAVVVTSELSAPIDGMPVTLAAGQER